MNGQSFDAVVSIDNGQVVADSRDVAAAFGRRHADVLLQIRDVFTRRPDLQRTFSFKIAKVETGKGGQRDSHYYTMNRKGFVVLVGGFKGDRALDFRIAFYDAFEEMERRIAQVEGEADALAAPATPAILDDHDRLRNAISFVRAAHLANRCEVARRAWHIAGLPDVFAIGAVARFAMAERVADPVFAAWANNHLEFVEGVRTSTQALFSHFRLWVFAHHHAPMSMTAFGRQLTQMGVVGFNSNGIKRVGVRLREDVA